MTERRVDIQFRDFVEIVEPRLHRALVARYGWERGREATAEALSFAWEHWERVSQMENPFGYLFRVGQSRSRDRKPARLFPPPTDREPWYEPKLARILSDLPERQRIVVVLIHGYEWSTREVAELLGIRPTTVQTHLARGLRRLRQQLEVGERV
jgi:RNA polymerase sigma-70 factor (ECF subfamily)